MAETEIKAGKKITINDSGITTDAGIDIGGDTSVNGNLSTTGNFSAQGDISAQGKISSGGNVEVKGQIIFTTSGVLGNYIKSDAVGTTIANESRINIALGSPPTNVYLFTSNGFISYRTFEINASISPAITINSGTMPNEIIIKDTSTNNYFSIEYDGSQASFVLHDEANAITLAPIQFNLSRILVKKNILPSGSVTLGNDSYRFRGIYLDGDIFSNGGASFVGSVTIGGSASIGADEHVSGNLMVDGSLSVGGTKNASVPSRSYPDNMDLRIRCAALESPFWSGIYFVTKATTQEGVAEIELPSYFMEAVDPKTIQAFITPIGKFCNFYYELQENKLIIHSDQDAELSVMVIGRRWDNAVIEDLRKEVWVDDFAGANSAGGSGDSSGTSG